MSAVADFKQSCGRKRRYRSRRSAWAALDRIDATRPRVGKLPVRAYFCPVCRGWHLTSSVDRRNR